MFHSLQKWLLTLLGFVASVTKSGGPKQDLAANTRGAFVHGPSDASSCVGSNIVSYYYYYYYYYYYSLAQFAHGDG